MKTLIYLEDAISAISASAFSINTVYGRSERGMKALQDAVMALKALPSAEQEVIRCKDCKHRPFDGEDSQGFGVEFPGEMCPCQCGDGWYNWRPDNEWYCGNARRRENNEA